MVVVAVVSADNVAAAVVDMRGRMVVFQTLMNQWQDDMRLLSGQLMNTLGPANVGEISERSFRVCFYIDILWLKF